MRLRWVQLLDNEGRPRSNSSRTEGLTSRICYDINAPIRDVHVVCHISDLEDRVVLSTGDCDVGRSISEAREPGQYIAEVRIPTALFNDGNYHLTLSLSVPFGTIHDRHTNVVSFSVTDTRLHGGPEYAQRRPGAVLVDLPWATRESDDADSRANAS